MQPRHRRPRTGRFAGRLVVVVLALVGAGATAAQADSLGGTDAGSVLVPPTVVAEGTASVLPRVVVPGTVLSPRPRPKAPSTVAPVKGYRLTGRFGNTSSLWRSAHTGLDFAAPSGKPIRAVAGGVVVSTGYDGSYGNKTVVRLNGGTELWYCHQSEIDVRPGQRVKAGQEIGAVGSTGNATGPHLHLEVRPRKDDPVDPDHWLDQRHVHV
jgi:murein DD-endopeptidase MepM/ murein hydrolase activator NlpD